MQAKLTLVVDGYSAPVTGGNFVRNVLEGLYEGAALSVNGGSVLTGGGATPGHLTFPICSALLFHKVLILCIVCALNIKRNIYTQAAHFTVVAKAWSDPWSMTNDQWDLQ